MIRRAIPFVIAVAAIARASPAAAHCDTTRGPVVAAARAALDASDVDLVLHWVAPTDEPAVRAAFYQALRVRALGPEARALADRSFFETVVRIHRAGEGAPFTGITDAPPEPIIAAADRALETGSSEALEAKLVQAVRAGLAERTAAARVAKRFQAGDVTAGRAFVAAYVRYTHWVEGVFVAAHGDEAHHAVAAHDEPAAGGHSSGGRSAWILVGLFGLAALIEGVVLVRRHVTA